MAFYSKTPQSVFLENRDVLLYNHSIMINFSKFNINTQNFSNLLLYSSFVIDPIMF